jgi:hypothetical protein
MPITLNREYMIERLCDRKADRLFHTNPRSSFVTGNDDFITKCILRYEARLRNLDMETLEYFFNRKVGA